VTSIIDRSKPTIGIAILSALCFSDSAFATPLPVKPCTLERLETKVFNRPNAELTFSNQGQLDQLTLVGTHQDENVVDRKEPRARTFLLSKSKDQGALDAWFFSDTETAGVLSFDYSGTARLSVHVQGVDYAYSEEFRGHCREAT